MYLQHVVLSESSYVSDQRLLQFPANELSLPTPAGIAAIISNPLECQRHSTNIGWCDLKNPHQDGEDRDGSALPVFAMLRRDKPSRGGTGKWANGQFALTLSAVRRLWRFIFPIVIEEVAEIVFDIPFSGEVGRFLCKLLDGLVAFLRNRIARIDLTPRPAEG